MTKSIRWCPDVACYSNCDPDGLRCVFEHILEQLAPLRTDNARRVLTEALKEINKRKAS